MKRKAFTTSNIARICDHSRETVKRWLERGEIKGYRVGPSGHWRVLAKDLAIFLKNNSIPFPEASDVGVDLETLTDSEHLPTFCWEFHKEKRDDHLRPDKRCEDCLVYKARCINCYALRREVGHKKIYCKYSCDECAYLPFVQREILPED
jgi:excisionase family DNA binding protein